MLSNSQVSWDGLEEEVGSWHAGRGIRSGQQFSLGCKQLGEKQSFLRHRICEGAAPLCLCQLCARLSSILGTVPASFLPAIQPRHCDTGDLDQTQYESCISLGIDITVQIFATLISMCVISILLEIHLTLYHSNMTICTLQICEGDAVRLDKACRVANVKLLIVRSFGLVGYLRVRLPHSQKHQNAPCRLKAL